MRIFNPFVAPAGLRQRVAQSFATIGSTGIGAEVLFTYNVLASQFAAAGNGLILTAWGDGLNNANAKSIGILTAGTLQTSNITINIGPAWLLTLLLMKSGANQQRALFYALSINQATNAVDQTRIVNQDTAGNEAVGYTVGVRVNTIGANDIFLRGVTVETF